MSNFFGIDPSTNTGTAQIDEDGNLIGCSLIVSQYGIDHDIERIEEVVTITVQWLQNRYRPNDLVCIESPSFGSKGRYVVQQGTIGNMMRIEMNRRGIKWIEVAPVQLKKFICGDHLASKDALVKPLKEKYGFVHGNDNVRDAFGLAQIARSVRTGVWLDKKQGEVISKILSKG